MARKNLHSGLMVQTLILLLLIPAVIFISKADPKVTTVTSSSFAVTDLSMSANEVNGRKSIAGNGSGNDLRGYSTPAYSKEPLFPAPSEGPGGPVLVISTASNPFSLYMVEILRAEGLNYFTVADISDVTAAELESYDVVLLGEMTIYTAQAKMFIDWVTAGGTLITFKPCSLLNSLLGISAATGTLSDKYLLVNTKSAPGAGIVKQTIQFHGSANLHTLNGATSIATLYSSAYTTTNNPAVTMINVGANGGKAIAFTYDLARSVVYTRQGNPAWAGQKRDGQINPIRSDDLFFPDWLDFDKIAIPQADEQQRLLANIILQSNLHRKPLPRFWYLPRDIKAVIVMTGDNHTNNGTTGRFYQYLTLGPNTAQDVVDWKAVRATSFIYPDRPINNEQAVFFEEQGFEISLHTNTGCDDYTPASLHKDLTDQLSRFAVSYPGVSAPVTNRSHCLNWSDWSSTPKIELQKGIRLDATYYYWPEAWTHNRPGMFTGSGIPMRFADMDGSLIDVYQMPTQMTDETNMNYGAFCNELLDKALGPEGYYGVFCANMHTDYKSSGGSDAIIASAQARQVPVISARQMLTWLDARNNSSFRNITWQNNQLNFSVAVQTDANNLRAMLPLYSETGKLISITCNENAIPLTIQTIKGMQYAFFSPLTGVNNYVAAYTGKKSEREIANQLSIKDKVPGDSLSVLPLYVNAEPNPSTKYFNMVTNSNSADPLTIRISDMSGRVIEIHEKIASTGIQQLGHDWRAGIYLAEVTQGRQRKVVKMVKVN